MPDATIEDVYQEILLDAAIDEDEIRAARQRWREVVNPRYRNLLDAETEDESAPPVDA